MVASIYRSTTGVQNAHIQYVVHLDRQILMQNVNKYSSICLRQKRVKAAGISACAAHHLYSIGQQSGREIEGTLLDHRGFQTLHGDDNKRTTNSHKLFQASYFCSVVTTLGSVKAESRMEGEGNSNATCILVQPSPKFHQSIGSLLLLFCFCGNDSYARVCALVDFRRAGRCCIIYSTT